MVLKESAVSVVQTENLHLRRRDVHSEKKSTGLMGNVVLALGNA